MTEPTNGPTPEPDPAATPRAGADRGILDASVVMAAGTAFSRVSGFLRGALLAAALGVALRADVFTVANTLPNMVYILVAGGVFNAVLVPQLVRAMKNDADGGAAYANRLITVAALFLGVVTVMLIVLTPWLLRLYLDGDYYAPGRADELQSAIELTRLCLPQVFFYGMFVLVGQILNARERFGPMMWAPIANNVVAVAMLLAYLVMYGRATRVEQVAPLTTGQELLLGVGSTLGIVVQFAILLPYLRSAGFVYRPRFDFRDAGLAHTLRLGVWTVLFVMVNQLAYLVVVRLASGGTIRDPDGTGLFVYSNAFLIMMVPHSIVTVSLTTAILPRVSGFAADERLGDIGTAIASTLRTALALVLPFAALLPVVSPEVSNAVFGWGEDTGDAFGPTLAVFAPALAFFTIHYLMLRGFYALEQTRLVFFIQCAIAAVNIAAAIGFVAVVAARDSPRATAPALALAYLCAYAAGSLISYLVLRSRLGGLHTPTLVRFLVRMALVLVAAAAATGLVRWALVTWLADPSPHPLVSLLIGGVAGATGMVVVVLGASVLRIREVTALLDIVTARLRRS